MKTKRTFALFPLFIFIRFFDESERTFSMTGKDGFETMNVWMMFFFSIGALGMFFSLVINLKKKEISLGAF